MDNKIKENLKSSYDKNTTLRDKKELASWKSNEMDKFMAFMKKEEKDTLLDLGAGPGQQSKIFKDKGIKVTSIDISTENIKSCKEKGLEAYVMDFYNLEFENESFDAVWAMNTLLHVPKNSIGKVFDNIKRILKPGGLFFMGVYGGFESEGVYEDDFYEPKRFFSFYKHEDIKELVQKHFEHINFQVIPVEGDGPDFQAITLRKGNDK